MSTRATMLVGAMRDDARDGRHDERDDAWRRETMRDERDDSRRRATMNATTLVGPTMRHLARDDDGRDGRDDSRLDSRWTP